MERGAPVTPLPAEEQEALVEYLKSLEKRPEYLPGENNGSGIAAVFMAAKETKGSSVSYFNRV